MFHLYSCCHPFPYLFSCGGNIRYLERDLGNAFSYEALLDKLRTMNFADIQEQGFIPLYTQDKLTDALHTVCGFETDYKFITKRQMKNIQKKSKGRK